MTERPPTIFEINDEDAPINKEREIVSPVSDEERAARAAEATYVDSEMAGDRAASLGEARDAVMAQFEDPSMQSASEVPKFLDYDGKRLKVSRIDTLANGKSWAVLEDRSIGGGERQMMLPEVQLKAPEAAVETQMEPEDAVHTEVVPEQQVVEPVPQEKSPIVVMDVIKQDETNSAVIAAEAHLRKVQVERQSSENERAESPQETEAEPGPGFVERVHDRVEHAREVIGNVEKKITSTLGQAENVLRQVEGYLDEFQNKNRFQMKVLSMEDKVKEIRFLVNKTANIIGETHGAISAGARALDTPLRLLETVTDQAGEDVATRELATESAADLRELKDASPTSLNHEDLRGIDSNLRKLQSQGQRMSREEMLGLVQGTLRMMKAYKDTRQGAQRPDSPKNAQLQRIARGLETYMTTHR